MLVAFPPLTMLGICFGVMPVLRRLPIAKATAFRLRLPCRKSSIPRLRAVNKQIARKSPCMTKTLIKILFRSGSGASARMCRPDLNAMYGTNTPKISRNQIASRSKCVNACLRKGRDTNTVDRKFFQCESDPGAVVRTSSPHRKFPSLTLSPVSRDDGSFG